MKSAQIKVPRPELEDAAIRNAETVAIPRGTPVILNLTSTAQPTTASDGYGPGYEDGLQVVLPSTAGATPSLNFIYGVALSTIPPGESGGAQVFGVCAYVLVTRMTRAASTDSWTSSASSSLAGGFLLNADTLNNAFKTYASTASLAQQHQGDMVMLDSMSSESASASATSDTRTAVLKNYRAFIRLM